MRLAYLHVVDRLAFGFHKLGEPMTLAEFRKVFHGPLLGNCGYRRGCLEALKMAISGLERELAFRNCTSRVKKSLTA